jgi:hypothetical protein
VAGAFVDKVTEWVDRSGGRVRADVVHEKLVSIGYTGPEETTRRMVSAVKAGYRRDRHRVHKPWVTEPNAWLQYDFGPGPVVDHSSATLFRSWLACIRFRVNIPLPDKSQPLVIAALDRTFHLIGGVPTYVLTNNDRTVADRHIAGIAVRNRAVVDPGRYYGVTIATCVPYDPESKGGPEAAVRVAKADLCQRATTWSRTIGVSARFMRACMALRRELNSRPHSVTRRVPAEMVETERQHLHAMPEAPFTVAFGESRSVGWSATVSFRGARYSVPDRLCDAAVWVRAASGEVIVITGEGTGAIEVARHRQVGPGQTSIRDEHYTHRHVARDPLTGTPKGVKPG